MPDFDLEQIVNFCTKDRAFRALMINDLCYRITEDEKPRDSIFPQKIRNRIFRGELEQVRRHFNIWYADWFAHYPHIEHKAHIRLVLALLQSCFRSKSVKTRVHGPHQ